MNSVHFKQQHIFKTPYILLKTPLSFSKDLLFNWGHKHDCFLTFASIDRWSDVWGGEEVGYSHDVGEAVEDAADRCVIRSLTGKKRSTGQTVQLPPHPPSLSETTSVLLSCYHLQLTTSVHLTQAWTRGRGTCLYVDIHLNTLWARGHFAVNKAPWSWSYFWWMGTDIQHGLHFLFACASTYISCLFTVSSGCKHPVIRPLSSFSVVSTLTAAIEKMFNFSLELWKVLYLWWCECCIGKCFCF